MNRGIAFWFFVVVISLVAVLESIFFSPFWLSCLELRVLAVQDYPFRAVLLTFASYLSCDTSNSTPEHVDVSKCLRNPRPFTLNSSFHFLFHYPEKPYITLYHPILPYIAPSTLNWAAVNELILSYYIGETR